MKAKRWPPTDPREWLRRAHSNLAHARDEKAEIDLAELCFDAQQAAEKAVKGVFIHRGETFPYSHDLERLLHLLEKNGLKIPKYVKDARELTQYAWSTRYPAFTVVTRRDHRRAVRIAAAVLRWAERQILPPAKKSKP